MNIAEEIRRAIAAHGHWTYRLRRTVVFRRSDFDNEVAYSDRACAFGQWLQTLPDDVRGTAHWRRVTELHAAFHAVAAEMVGAARMGHAEDALDAPGLRDEFFRVSARLFAALRRWRTAELVREVCTVPPARRVDALQSWFRPISLRPRKRRA